MTAAEATGTAPPLTPVSLRGKQIPYDVLSIIPLDTAERFHVIAFEQSPERLKLAIIHPEQLKQGFFLALKQIGIRIGRQIDIYQGDPEGFKEIMVRYRRLAREHSAATPVKLPQPVIVQTPAPSPKPVPAQPLPLPPLPPLTNGSWPAAPPPPLFELGRLVAYNYLKRIPYDFARQHRVVCVDYLKPRTYWFVSDGGNDKELQPLVDFIAKTNQIQIYMLIVSKADLDSLIVYYGSLVAKEKQEQAKEKAEQEKVEKQEEDEEIKNFINPSVVTEAPRPVAKDVILSDLPAAIVSSEQERGGLAGIFQKVAQNFLAQEAEKAPALPSTSVLPPAEEKPVPPPASSAPQPVASPTPPGTTVQPASPPTVPPAPTPAAAPVQPEKTRRLPADEGDIGKLLSSQVTTLEQLKNHIRSGQIPRIVAAIVSYAIHEKASDIHLEPFEDEMRVRYRVDGQLVDVVKLSPDVQSPVVSRIKILSKLKLDENRIPQDGRFDVNFDHAQVDLRVSVMPTVHGEKVVARILDKGRGIASLESLGIEGKAYDDITQAIQKPFGICLATGPTGSGKSTSLYAILQRIATSNVNVVTLEDPVEYEMKGINQSQIRPKIGYTFADGLRSILRQDPNIIMVGEIRDGETANMATQAALTGHLVLSTLHTNDAAGAIPRLANMGIEPFLITSSLNMAMGQRLVRKICSHCKQVISVPAAIKDQMEKDLEIITNLNPVDARRIKRPLTFYQGTGCDKCGGKGYQGRIGIYEVLIMTPKIEELTLARASADQMADEAKATGMLNMYQDGLVKVTNGITTIDEVLRETSNK